MATAVAMTDCTIDKIEKSLMARMLHEQHDVSELFVKHLLHATSDTKRISSTSFSTRAKSVWPGFFYCFPFRQGEQGRTGNSQSESGYPGANGRYDPVANQSFHEQVQEHGLSSMTTPD